MRILLIHQYFLGRNDPGGSRWNQFARYWAEAGHEVTVLAGTVHYATGRKEPLYKSRLITREQDRPGVEVYRCHVSESYNRSFAGRLWAYLSFAFSSTIAGLLHAPKPDVIVATSPPLTVAVTMCLLALFRPAPRVFEVRDLWPESAVDTGVLRSRLLIRLSYILEKLAYRRASRINALTPAFVEALVSRKAVPREKVSMIPNGADIDLLKPGPKQNRVRRELGLEDKFVVSYFGAHGRANRLGQLLDVAELAAEMLPDVRIMFVGDGMEKPHLVEQASRRGLSNVVFHDPVPKKNVADYINASDVCTAVLMRNETFKTVYPNKLFDYMCCMRPIIVGIDGVARKLVEDAGAGLFAEPEDPASFLRALSALRADPRLRDRMGRGGYEYVVRLYNREDLAERFLKMLENLTGREGDAPGHGGAGRD